MIVDDFNLQILSLLKDHARIPYSSIGQKIGLTAPAVTQRIAQMETAGLIKGYTIELDKQQLGFNLKAMIALRLGLGKITAFRKIVGQLEEVETCYRVTGEDCFVMIVHLKDNNHLIQFIDRLEKYGITKTSIILNEL